mmetsp:Transcript_85444/g.242237  ORF Transcript_85444/g.242237 Transcript_85444/m.242237 type:complete len:223 (+) Transcript_85444:2106-2774(+)
MSCAAVSDCPSGASRPPRPRPSSSAWMSSASSVSTKETWTVMRSPRRPGPLRGSCTLPGCSTRFATRAGPRPRWTSSTASSCFRSPRARPRSWTASCSPSARASWATTWASCGMRLRRGLSMPRHCGRACGSSSHSSRCTRTAWRWTSRPPRPLPPWRCAEEPLLLKARRGEALATPTLRHATRPGGRAILWPGVPSAGRPTSPNGMRRLLRDRSHSEATGD